MGWIVQVVPFQRSASMAGPEANASPTAVQTEADGQATLLRKLP